MARPRECRRDAQSARRWSVSAFTGGQYLAGVEGPGGDLGARADRWPWAVDPAPHAASSMTAMPRGPGADRGQVERHPALVDHDHARVRIRRPRSWGSGSRSSRPRRRRPGSPRRSRVRRPWRRRRTTARRPRRRGRHRCDQREVQGRGALMTAIACPPAGTRRRPAQGRDRGPRRPSRSAAPPRRPRRLLLAEVRLHHVDAGELRSPVIPTARLRRSSGGVSSRCGSHQHRPGRAGRRRATVATKPRSRSSPRGRRRVDSVTPRRYCARPEYRSPSRAAAPQQARQAGFLAAGDIVGALTTGDWAASTVARAMSVVTTRCIVSLSSPKISGGGRRRLLHPADEHLGDSQWTSIRGP